MCSGIDAFVGSLGARRREIENLHRLPPIRSTDSIAGCTQPIPCSISADPSRMAGSSGYSPSMCRIPNIGDMTTLHCSQSGMVSGKPDLRQDDTVRRRVRGGVNVADEVVGQQLPELVPPGCG